MRRSADGHIGWTSGADCGRRSTPTTRTGSRAASAGLALLLVGGDGAWQVLAREPMLRSGIYRRVVFRALSGEQVCTLIPRFHPVYAGVEAELVLFIDDHFAHDNLRDWTAFTATAAQLCRAGGHDRVDESIVRNAFALHGGTRSTRDASR